MAVERRKSHFIIPIIAAFIVALNRALTTLVKAMVATPSTAATDALTGTGFATAAQVVTTTESFTVSLNQYAGCWLLAQGLPPCLIVSHPAAAAAPVAFTVFGPAPATAAVAFKVLKGPVPGAVEEGAPSPVHADADERLVTIANATDTASAITLLKGLLVTYAAHRVDTIHHSNADTTNTVASSVADVVDLASANTAANQLRTAMNAHRSQAGVHFTDDAGNAVSSPIATSEGTLVTLVNEMKADMNGHFAAATVGAVDSWRVID